MATGSISTVSALPLSIWLTIGSPAPGTRDPNANRRRNRTPVVAGRSSGELDFLTLWKMKLKVGNELVSFWSGSGAMIRHGLDYPPSSGNESAARYHGGLASEFIEYLDTTF